MHFVTEALVAILIAYSTFTNYLADGLISFLPTDEAGVTAVVIDEQAETDSRMSFLPSNIGKIIPDILLNNAAYQQATLNSAAGLTGGITDEPLEAIVNIFCTFTTTEYIRTTTGTGFFIDPDGVIMSNAHVAQFLLLEETDEFGNTECIVRGGNPAAPQYKAELLYLPPAWIQENASIMNDEVPMGTGERDYALLYVSETISGDPLPARFPALNFDSALLPISTKDTDVTAAGYPAGNLLANGPEADLIPRSAETSVSELYTFGSNYADVFSIRGSSVGAEGASGGPVVNSDGAVIGMIVTRGDDATDGAGSLRAITLSHIERTILEETGFSLQDNLNGNLAYRSRIFSETLAPFLVTILQNER